MIVQSLKTAFLAAAAVGALWAGQVQAATHTLNLTGVVADGSYSSQTIGPTQFDQWVLSLSGLSSDNAITVAEGDTIEATITLDQLFTAPASVDITVFGLFLQGPAFPAGDVSASGTFTFFNGVDVAKSGAGGTDTAGQVAHSVAYFPPDNGAITFDSISATFTIDLLPEAVSLDFAGLTYTLFSPSGAVPEPATWALMILGFGGAGAMLRRRRLVGV